MNDSQAKSVFADLVNRGGLTYPCNNWLDNVILMYDLFNFHHNSKVSLFINFFIALLKSLEASTVPVPIKDTHSILRFFFYHAQ